MLAWVGKAHADVIVHGSLAQPLCTCRGMRRDTPDTTARLGGGHISPDQAWQQSTAMEQGSWSIGRAAGHAELQARNGCLQRRVQNNLPSFSESKFSTEPVQISTEPRQFDCEASHGAWLSMIRIAVILVLPPLHS